MVKFVYTQNSVLMHKRTNIEIDVNLLAKAMELTELTTIKEVVHYSLKEIIKMSKRQKLLSLKGNITWEGDLDQMRLN